MQTVRIQGRYSEAIIYTTDNANTALDEAPFAYRGMEEILEAIHDTVEVAKILRPVYNFKAGASD